MNYFLDTALLLLIGLAVGSLIIIGLCKIVGYR
jgi:hypothetical protein